MVIGRGRHREHLIYENKRWGGSFLWLSDAAVVENPQPTFCTTTKKKIQENSMGKRVRRKVT